MYWFDSRHFWRPMSSEWMIGWAKANTIWPMLEHNMLFRLPIACYLVVHVDGCS